MTTQSLEGLLERVKAATGSDRELDAAIFCVLNPEYRLSKNQLGGTVIMRDGFRWSVDDIVPYLTASADAALDLVERCLPGHWQRLLDEAMAEVVSRSFETDSDPNLKELPLAILAALLTALKDASS